jgi:hypothetical protein
MSDHQRNPGCEDTFPVDFPNIVNLFSLFGLSAETLHPLMHRTGAILAGGAMMNMRYNLEHEEDDPPFTPTPLHPDSDLDFWIADPTPLDSHPRRVYYNLICELWDAYLHTAAGYESYCPETPGDYEEVDGDRSNFLTECRTRLRIRYYQRPNVTAHRRIQLIFYDTHEFPVPARIAPWHLVEHFDLTICQIMLYASVTNQLWIGHVSRIDDVENHILRRRNPEDPPTQRTQARIERYLSRYPTLHLEGSSAGAAAAPTG